MDPSADLAVRVEGLRRTFGSTVAVDRVDLAIPKGSQFGLVGPNGAGKTTTLRAITGLLRPDEGEVVVAGVDVWPDPRAAKARIGVLPDEVRLFERLTGKELLTYMGLLRSLDPAEVDQRSDELLEVLGLVEASTTLVTDYSTGMRKKIALGVALLHAPKVVFLDEPFESVDPVSARVLQGVLDRYRTGGGTVVFSSHVMDTVERLCTHVAIIHAGGVVAQGEIHDVQNGRRLEDVFIDAVGATGEHRDESLAWLTSGQTGEVLPE